MPHLKVTKKAQCWLLLNQQVWLETTEASLCFFLYLQLMVPTQAHNVKAAAVNTKLPSERLDE